MGGMSGKSALSVALLVALAGCAKHKIMPVATPVLSPPAAPHTAGPPPILANPAKNTPTPAQKQGIKAISRSAEVNRLLNEPPRMSLVPAPRAPKNSVQSTDKITVLVDTTDGTLRPASPAMIQKAFAPLAEQFLLVCPDQMRVGTSGDCRFATKVPLEDLFREQLVRQGIPAAEAVETTLLVHADLTSLEKNAFDIRAATSNSASREQLWHVAPLSAGDHKLQLKVVLTARIASAGEVSGEPVVLVRSVSVVGENFFNQYWPAIIGCAALLALFGWIAMTFWRDARPSALSPP